MKTCLTCKHYAGTRLLGYPVSKIRPMCGRNVTYITDPVTCRKIEQGIHPCDRSINIEGYFDVNKKHHTVMPSCNVEGKFHEKIPTIIERVVIWLKWLGV